MKESNDFENKTYRICDLLLIIALYLLHDHHNLTISYGENNDYQQAVEVFINCVETSIVPMYDHSRPNTDEENKIEQELIKRTLSSDEPQAELNKRIQNIKKYKAYRRSYNKHFDGNCASISIPAMSVTVKNALRNYIDKLKNNMVSGGKNYTQWSKHLQEFKNSIDRNFIITDYYINDAKYIDIIIDGYFNKSIKINSISFSIDEKQLDSICEYDSEYNELYFNKNFTGYTFSCSLDLSAFLYNKKETTTTTKKESEEQQRFKALNSLLEKNASNKVIHIRQLEEVIDSVRKNKNKLSNKRYKTYISDYRRNGTGKYTISKEPVNGYYDIYLRKPKDTGN